jgi:hypothetical protein
VACGCRRWRGGCSVWASPATLAANVAHGLGHGPAGAAVGARPAVALVGSYELLMMIIRGAQSEPTEASAVAGTSDAVSRIDPLHARAAEEFADEVAAGRMPPIRAIRARLHVGQPRAQQVQAHLGTLIRGGRVRETEFS